MRLITSAEISERREFFEIMGATSRSQIASMILEPDQTSGEYGTDHPDSDQILMVLAGKGEVTISDETIPLAEGDVCVIEAGKPHQVRNVGSILLKTLNFYSPPAY